VKHICRSTPTVLFGRSAAPERTDGPPTRCSTRLYREPTTFKVRLCVVLGDLRKRHRAPSAVSAESARMSSHRNTATPDREMATALDLAVVGRTDGHRRRTGRSLHRREVPRQGRSWTCVSWTADGRPRHGRRDWVPDLEVVVLGDSYPGVPVEQATELWSSSRAADELRPVQPCFGNGREGARLPTHRMRQLDPGRSVVRGSASGLGSNE
jgi:hypothetical protein